jgi:hypothetical protein
MFLTISGIRRAFNRASARKGPAQKSEIRQKEPDFRQIDNAHLA